MPLTSATPHAPPLAHAIHSYRQAASVLHELLGVDLSFDYLGIRKAVNLLAHTHYCCVLFWSDFEFFKASCKCNALVTRGTLRTFCSTS